MRLFATTARGCESVLAAELEELGATRVSPRPAGVAFEGDLRVAYRACLWSRVASRILMNIGAVEAADPDQLYAGIRAVEWESHMTVDSTFAVGVTRSASASIEHTRYAIQRVKDAVVDRFRDRQGRRPSVDTESPDLRISVHLGRREGSLSIDLSGAPLHRRGYRGPGGVAPLKENLAAAVLLRAGWGVGGSDFDVLLDPMCGAGTLLIEAAHIAADVAPGLSRRRFGFQGWLGHEPEVWAQEVEEAGRRERAAEEAGRSPRIVGYDADRAAVAASRYGIEAAGLADTVTVDELPLADLLEGPLPEGRGLLVTNPPWGERIGDPSSVEPLYEQLGTLLRTRLTDWRAAVLTGNPGLGLRMGLEARKRHTMQNGPIECQLLLFDVGRALARESSRAAKRREPVVVSDGARAFGNRLRKRAKAMRKWAEKESIDCYRIYDSDLPEYAVAVDRYGSWIHLQEYAAPKSIDPGLASRRLDEAVRTVSEVLNVPRERIVVKRREKQRGRRQYERHDHRAQELEVREGPARLLVNLHDYLDTGLFLDHRITRAMIRESCAGKRFLNLYGYTGTATVHAALGGAVHTTTVDLSRTYLDWARRNLELNGFTGPEHVGVQADCRAWLYEDGETYDLIFLDPPTFSNSKRTERTLDVQRDHVELILACMKRLAPGGQLLFSSNSRRFRLDVDGLPDLSVEDISRETLPKDFERNPRIHQAFRIRHGEPASS